MSSIRQFIHEVHRRSLWQVLLIYVGAGWVVFEIVQTVTEGLGLPQWFPAFAALLLLIGLPVVLATAFVREGEPAGTASDPTLLPVEASGSTAARRRRVLTWRNAGLSFMAALAVWGIVATGWLVFGERATPEEVDARKSIAVLPLENLSREEATQPFTDGIHDDILTHLSNIADLKVISRTSVMEYRDTRKNLREIADELGVATILEGGVQQSGNRVRINVQLIDAETDEHLWAETYEEELTAGNVFAIQTAIAQRITSALKAHLTPEENARIAARPTENLEAYEHYLRGEALVRRRGGAIGQLAARALSDSATAEYQRAVELDPEYYPAWAALAEVHTSAFFEFTEATEKREKAEQALARAVELAPESFETHMARSKYNWLVLEDLPQAMHHLVIAETLRPNDSEVLVGIARLLRFQGKWEEALTKIERLVELDPQNARLAHGLAAVNRRMRRFDEAERYYDRAIALDPSAPGPYSGKFILYLWGLGDTIKARVFAEQHPNDYNYYWLHLVRRDYEPALDSIRSTGPNPTFPWRFLRVLYLTGRLEEARAIADSVAREWRKETPHESRTDIQLSWRRSYLGLAYAHAGDSEAALREAEAALELYPVATDYENYWIIVDNVCEIYILAGEHEAAIDQLDVLLSAPTFGAATARLRLDPIYDPLRDHPRFQALLTKHE